MQQHDHLSKGPEIDYSLFVSAQSFYTKLGYINKHLPWAVPRTVSTITATTEKLIPLNKEYDLVGSAEQAFIWEFTDRNLTGSYQSLTPCFRNEPVFDDLHLNYFMKLELFSTDKHADELIDDALKFHKKFISAKCYTKVTDEGVDIMYEDVELGSYGFRHVDFKNWAFGTGLALPRATNIG